MGTNWQVKCTDNKLMVTEKLEPDTDPQQRSIQLSHELTLTIYCLYIHSKVLNKVTLSILAITKTEIPKYFRYFAALFDKYLYIGNSKPKYLTEKETETL